MQLKSEFYFTRHASNGLDAYQMRTIPNVGAVGEAAVKLLTKEVRAAVEDAKRYLRFAEKRIASVALIRNATAEGVPTLTLARVELSNKGRISAKIFHNNVKLVAP